MKWCRIKAFMVRDVKSTLRDKAVIFWIFVWPIIWILMAAYVFIPPGTGSPTTIDLGVVNNDASHTPLNGSWLIKMLSKAEYNGTKIFNIRNYEYRSELVNDLRKGRLDAGINIPEGFGENISTGQAYVEVFIGAKDPYSSQISTAIIMNAMNELSKRIAYVKINYICKYIPVGLIETLLKGIAEPVSMSIRSVKPEAYADRSSIIGWYTIGSIGMVFLYGGFSQGALMIVEEREKRVLKRILSTPATGADLLVGKTLSGLLILGLSSLTALLTGVFICGARIVWNPLKPVYWLVPVLTVLTGLMSIGVGVILSLFTKSVKGASSLATILGLMLAFTAGIWFPNNMLPSWMQILSKNFPITWAIDTIRSIMVYSTSLGEIWVTIVKIIVATTTIYTSAILAYKTLIRKYVET